MGNIGCALSRERSGRIAAWRRLHLTAQYVLGFTNAGKAECFVALALGEHNRTGCRYLGHVDDHIFTRRRGQRRTSTNDRLACRGQEDDRCGGRSHDGKQAHRRDKRIAQGRCVLCLAGGHEVRSGLNG